MADAACGMGKTKYDRLCFMIRSKAFKAYMEGKWQISDLYKQQIEKLQQSNHACAYCGKVFSSPKEATIDHIFPRIKGGTNEMENIVFACKTCNSSKGDRDMFGWYIEHFGEFPSIYLTTILKRSISTHKLTISLMPNFRHLTLSTCPSIGIAFLSLTLNQIILLKYSIWKM